ncbi:MAG: amidase family protein, partial [Acidimicrobiia bacterium]|nr:amidase family protein [Acidimicrobiia bacterium]
VIAATNPGPAFAADAPTSNPNGSQVEKALSSRAGMLAFRAALGAVRTASSAAPSLPDRLIARTVERDPDLVAMGGLTVVSNVYGNPAVSIPAGTVRGLPVGMQVLAPHHHDALLFDVALVKERERPWPLVAPT